MSSSIFTPPSPVYETWSTNKPCINSHEGVVSTHHPEACHAAIWALNQGGNAFDAAVAAAFSLCVCEPWGSGLGGGGFATFHTRHDKKNHAISFEMPCPKALNPDDFIPLASKTTDIFSWPSVFDDLNRHGAKSIGIPGAVSGYSELLRQFGRLSWRTVITPAVELAKRGHLITWWTTVKTAEQARLLSKYAESKRIWLPDGYTPAMSETIGAHRYLTLNTLSQTLKTLQDEGPESFYHGRIAERLLRDVQSAGGYWKESDLTAYQSCTTPTLHTLRNGFEIHAPPGLCAGKTLLEALDIMPHQKNTKPIFYKHLASTLDQVTKKRLQRDGHRAQEAGSTSNISVVDREGNMIALTTTLLSVFGSKFTSSSTGILLNNAVYWFNPVKNHFNGCAGGAKPLTNMCPTLLIRDKHAVAAIGGSGGRRILPAVFQSVLHITDRKNAISEAIQQARIDTSEHTRIHAPASVFQRAEKQLSNVAPTVVHESIANPNAYAVLTAVERKAGINYGAVSSSFPLTMAKNQ